MSIWIVYILECADGSRYTGITNDLQRRLNEHFTSRGGHYTETVGVSRLLWQEAHPDKYSAAKRERQLKGWTRHKKLALIAGDFALLKGL